MEPDGGTMKIRNVKSKHWTLSLGPKHRYVVPLNSYSEFNKADGRDICRGREGSSIEVEGVKATSGVARAVMPLAERRIGRATD